MAWRFSGRCQALSYIPPELIEVEWHRSAAGSAFVPHLPQSLEIFPPQLMFELPVAYGLTDDFAGDRIFAGLDRGFEGSYLFASQGEYWPAFGTRANCFLPTRSSSLYRVS
jgi:hypothetical protein